MRRSKLDIYADILNVAREGAKKTQIVYKANLNFKIIKEYLSILISKGLVDNSDQYYITTKQGTTFLENYQKLNRVSLIV